jgi:hypothetical protein
VHPEFAGRNDRLRRSGPHTDVSSTLSVAEPQPIAGILRLT